MYVLQYDQQTGPWSKIHGCSDCLDRCDTGLLQSGCRTWPQKYSLSYSSWGPICSSARKCGDSWEMESSSNLFIYMWRGKSERASAKFVVSCQKMVWKEIILQWVLKLRNSSPLSSFFPIAMSQHKGWEKKSAWWPSLVFLNQHCYMVDCNTLYRQI